jgi:hypothetical protein
MIKTKYSFIGLLLFLVDVPFTLDVADAVSDAVRYCRAYGCENDAEN